MEFVEFPKIARLSRECVITEKIDGTNGQIHIIAEADFLSEYFAGVGAIGPKSIDGRVFWMLAGSRTQYIRPERDNHAFAAWVWAHAEELWALGEGRHFGEWWGSGIQRGYGLPKGEKRFSLFNVARWHAVGTEPYVSVSADPRQPPKFSQPAPACCHVVPVIHRGQFDTADIGYALDRLAHEGSAAAPGFMNPEGVIVYHTASGQYFKKTIERDEEPKSKRAGTLVAAVG